MTRLLWSAVATLFLVAIAAPCLTFYLLIREYWTEVGSLRQELLLCQLGSSTPLPKSSPLNPLQESLHDDLRNDPSLQDTFPSLPVPQPLTSNREPILVEGMTDDYLKSNGADAFPPFPSSNSPRKLEFEGRKSSHSVLPLPSRILATKDPSVRRSLLKDVMVSDATVASGDDDKNVCLSKEYVQKVEKRVVDLSARVDACRRCLKPESQKESRCGGGASWREYRRKERLARKEMREEKRRRRKKERQLGGSNTTAEFRVSETVSMPSIETTPGTTSDMPSLFGLRSEDYQSSNTHNLRQNHRASTDFRRGFNQKIVRMDEALMQFTETQSAFCKGLRDNLGGSLEKRGKELEALSEQIAALVRTTTSQVAMIEKLTSDQVYAGQTRIEKNLDNLQTLRDDQVRSIQDFHKKTFLPAMVTLTSLLGEQASSVTNMGVDLITKIEMLQDFFLTFSTQQGDTLIKLTEEVNMFTSKHGNLIMRSKDHAKHLHINTENFIRELQTRMNNVVKELVLVRLQSQTFVSVNQETYHEISASLNKTTNMVETLSGDLERRIDKAKTAEADFRKEFQQETELITNRIESGISDVLIRNHAAGTQVGEIELEARMHSNTADAAWNELYGNQETELRQEADMLANNLRSHTHHTQNILTGLQGTAGTHEQVLEQQRMDFQGFIKKRQEALDTQCSSISDWALLMSSELRRRDEDLHRFLNEDMRYSPVTAQGGTEYDDYLVSRLPDGTLLYDSSSSDSFHSSRSSSSNVTQPSEEESETISIQSSATSSLNNSLLPKSNRPNHHSPPEKVLFTSSQEEGGVDPPHPIPSSRNPPKEQQEEEDIPLRGDLIGVERKGKKQTDASSERVEAISNEIRVENVDEFDNKISHQSDQGVLSNSSRVFGCHSNNGNHTSNCTNSLSAINASRSEAVDNDDVEFQKLQNILLEAKLSIFRFQQEFQVNENIRELKKNVWNRFNENRNRSRRKSRLSGRGFFNYRSTKGDKVKIPSFWPSVDNETSIDLDTAKPLNQTQEAPKSSPIKDLSNLAKKVEN